MKWYRRVADRRAKYKEVFETGEGPWVLADLIKACGFGQDPHTPGDSHTTEYLVGRAFVGLHIQTILAMTDAEIAAMVKQYEAAEQLKDKEILE